ncbi:hypothetical protein RB653_002939 [Dictyostelium firmibasis]|uniref:Pre-mRNA-processing factor 19 n=1 Tax=Dictyostelium firmibasis TaxID=79012 RepID=A0AAN7TYA7_9MYCE
MICAISGSTPEEPVISTKTGNVYEKRLIEKYIDTNGKEPTTGEPLGLSDLITVKIGKTVKPRPTTATSIPSMLQLFQNEWDSLMLETFTLKQQHETVRQELAHSMYQYDAACRVIARLVKERDAARSALANARNIVQQQQQQTNNKDVEMSSASASSEDNLLDSTIYKRIAEKSEELIKTRKERTHQGLPEPDAIKQFKISDKIETDCQIKSLEVNSQDNNLIAMGGVNGNVYVYSRDTNELCTAIKGSGSTVNKVLFAPNNIIVSAGSDAVIRVSKGGESPSKKSTYTQYKACYQFTHKASVTDISLHVLGDYVISSSLDKSLNMYDIVNGSLLTSFGQSQQLGYTSVAFHPDGMFFAAGTQNGVVKIFDLKSKVNNFNFQGLSSAVNCISFSENGYYLTAADNNTVKLFDLRKAASKNSPDIQTITLDNQQIKSINFDYSSQYLGIASSNQINLYSCKSKQKPPISHIHSIDTDCLDFKWARPNSNFFVSSSSSKNIVNIFSN